MTLIQLLLPLYDNAGQRFERQMYEQVSEELTEKFGGLTSYSRAPAKGLWEDPDGNAVHDELVVYEVMVKQLDRSWWRDYRHQLEKRFSQESMVIRALVMDML